MLRKGHLKLKLLRYDHVKHGSIIEIIHSKIIIWMDRITVTCVRSVYSEMTGQLHWRLNVRDELEESCA